MTFDNLADEWITGRLARREIQPTTAKTLRHWLYDLSDWLGPDYPIESVTLNDIELWLARPRKNGRPYGPQSQRNRAIPIRSFFAWAARTGHIHHDVAAGLQLAKTPKRLRKAIPPDAVARLLWVAGMRDRTILLTGLQLGLRRAEIHGMNVEHWDRTGRLLYVIGKGDKERVLPVEGEMAAALERWVDLGLGGRRAGPMWTTQGAESERLSHSQIGERVRKIAVVAQVAATTHSLRHTCACDMAEAGVPPHVIQEWLGHESLSTTSIYVRARAQELRAVAALREYLPSGLAAAA